MKVNIELTDKQSVEITDQQLKKIYDDYKLTNEMRITCDNYFKSDFVAHGNFEWNLFTEGLALEEIDFSVDVIKASIEDGRTDNKLAYGKKVFHYLPNNNEDI